MAKEVKDSDLITVEKDGNKLEVTAKAFRIHYAGLGYKEVKKK